MAAVTAHRTVEAPFTGEQKVVRITYDFALDGGATGVLDHFTAGDALVIKDYHCYVETAATSGGSATMIVGVIGGDTDACIDATSGAVANYSANAVIGKEAATPCYLAAGGKMGQTIATDTFLTGKIHHVYTVMKP
jgi:hypothetical protein